MSDAHYNPNHPLVKDYREKLHDLLKGELTILKEEGNHITVEGTLDIARFLDCYINTRKEIQYEFLTRVMALPMKTVTKSDIMRVLKDMLNIEPITS